MARHYVYPSYPSVVCGVSAEPSDVQGAPVWAHTTCTPEQVVFIAQIHIASTAGWT